MKTIINIKQAITDRGYTIATFADKLGTSAINLRENTIKGNPTVKKLNQVADALGCDISDLFYPEDGSQAFHTNTGKPISQHLDIKRALTEHGMTQAELCKRTGMLTQNIRTITNGNPSLNKLLEVANGIGCNVSDLFYPHKDKEENEAAHQVPSIQETEEPTLNFNTDSSQEEEHKHAEEIPATETSQAIFCPHCGTRFLVLNTPDDTPHETEEPHETRAKMRIDLRKLMQKLGMGTNAFAKACGVSTQSMAQYLRPDKALTTTTIYNISDALNIDPRDMFFPTEKE